MITKYLNWLTKMAEGVTIKEVMPVIIIFCMVCMIMSLGITIAAYHNLTWKKIIKSTVILTPYIMIIFTWTLYFCSDPIYIIMMPLYPLVVAMVIKYLYKKYREKKFSGGN